MLEEKNKIVSFFLIGNNFISLVDLSQIEYTESGLIEWEMTSRKVAGRPHHLCNPIRAIEGHSEKKRKEKTSLF